MSANKDGGALVTRPDNFTGKHLFVNVDCLYGEIRVEVLNEDNTVIVPISADMLLPEDQV